MSESGRTRAIHSCRVSTGPIDFVAGSNDGGFALVTPIPVAAFQIDTDDIIQPGDTFIAECETTLARMASVERVSDTRIVVRPFDDTGVNVATAFALTWYRVFRG